MKQEINFLINRIEESFLPIEAENSHIQIVIPRNIQFEKTINLEQYTQLQQSVFPETELLRQKDMKKVMKSIENMLERLGLSIGFPKSLPLKLRYSFLRSVWSSGTLAITSEGVVEVCNYNIDDCPFPGYCKTCEEMVSRIKLDEHLQRGGFDEVDEIF
jgi:hypothetical protein